MIYTQHIIIPRSGSPPMLYCGTPWGDAFEEDGDGDSMVIAGRDALPLFGNGATICETCRARYGYAQRDSELAEIIQTAARLNVLDWVDRLCDWGKGLAEGIEWTPQHWYWTDMRHLANLASPHHWGYIADKTDPKREDALMLLGDQIHDWIDRFFEEDEAEETDAAAIV